MVPERPWQMIWIFTVTSLSSTFMYRYYADDYWYYSKYFYNNLFAFTDDESIALIKPDSEWNEEMDFKLSDSVNKMVIIQSEWQSYICMKEKAFVNTSLRK